MSAVWDFADFDDHEHVHMFRDRASGLTAVIAVHSTHLGPGAGGVRYWHYPQRAAAITDALRLSRGMSYKNAMAGDRKSTRPQLQSLMRISYAVFCLKKKKELLLET